MSLTKNIAILFSGNGSNLENIYRSINGRVYNNILINISIGISNKSDAYGISRCNMLGLKCEVLESRGKSIDEYDLQLINLLLENNIDLVVLAGFMKILGNKMVSTFKIINIHPSILPLFKGANGLEESYKSYMKIAGVSIHYVNEELDGGELIMQDIIHKIEGEDFNTFKSRIHTLEHKLYPQAILKVLGCMI